MRKNRSAKLLFLAAAVALFAPTAQAATVDGFLEAAPPVHLEGELSAQLADPTILLGNPVLGMPDVPLVLHADRIHVTQKIFETETYVVDTPVYGTSLEGPGGASETRTFTAENATLEISAIGAEADILLAPMEQEAFFASLVDRKDDGPDVPDGGMTQLTVAEEVRVLDGYRKIWGERMAGDARGFEYEYTRAGPLVNTTGIDAISLRGGSQGYIWDAHMHLLDGNGTVTTVTTGHEVEEEAGGAMRSDRYVYVRVELENMTAELRPGDLRSSIFTPGLNVALDGAVTLPSASGTFTAGEDVYRTDGARGVTIDGNLSLAFTPVVSSTRDRLSVGLGGQAEDLSLLALPSAKNPFVENLAVVGAGSATVVGLAAAWYVLSVKGASVAALLARPTRKEEGAEAPAAPPTVEVQRPGDLLLDTDRFTLYHLIKAQAGLSAEECRRRTGIDEAGAHLETLAQHNLLVPMAEDPRRYCLPGMVHEERARRISMLRDEEVFSVASVLAIHGLMPVGMLLERASKTEASLDPATTRRLLDRLIHRGLALREDGRDGPVVDATPELYTCLRLMGERALVPDM